MVGVTKELLMLLTVTTFVLASLIIAGKGVHKFHIN